jgi:recombination protein RecA
VAVYVDTETSVSKQFLEAIGVDVSNMLYLHLETVEDIFSAIEEIVTKVRESDKDRLVTILVDSLAAATTKVELEADFDKDGWATAKAIIISKALRKITQMIGRQKIALVFTNQLRQKLGVSFGDPWCVDPETTNIKIRYDEDSPFFGEYHNKLQQMTQENTNDRKNS